MNFLETIKKQIIVMDGAMGTMIQSLNLSDDDFGGKEFNILYDILVFSKKSSLKKMHTAYFKAGANCVETNTFGSNPFRLQEFNFKNINKKNLSDLPADFNINKADIKDISYKLSLLSSKTAKEALNDYKKLKEYDGRPLFVIGSIGPSNYVLSPTKAELKKSTFDEIKANFYIQAKGLIDGGCDVLLFETQQDVLELKAGIFGAQEAIRESKKKIPIMAQVTVDEFSRMQIFGTKIESVITTLSDIGIDTLGINCSLGPELMEDAIKKLSLYSKLPISVLPNAGMPILKQGIPVYDIAPKVFTKYLKNYITKYGINIVGGCCGTNPTHIKELASAVKDIKPKKREVSDKEFISGPQERVSLDSTKDIIRIGERLNVRGSKIVKQAVELETKVDFNALEKVASNQTKELGLKVLDVCMDSNIVNTQKTLGDVIYNLCIDFDGALSIDSFETQSLIEAVKKYPGKPIINSVSIEKIDKKESKIDIVLKQTACHSPYYVIMLADEEGPAKTCAKKIEIAEKSIKECKKYGVTPSQLFVDINAFPIGSETNKEENFALESLKSIKGIKKLNHKIKTIIGVGNLTNGLAKKAYMRLVLTSVFLDEGKKLGLDAAIVNPSHYVPVESIDKKDYKLGQQIILKKDMTAFEKLEEIAEKKVGIKKKTVSYEKLTVKEKIYNKIKEARKEHQKGKVKVENLSFNYEDKIVLDVAEALKELKPLELINEYLIPAMKDIGDDFAEGKVSLPHLLKSADLMKYSMEFIENYMQKKEGRKLKKKRGLIVLGTVYQDVHSIGKDLTKTLFENYNYEVIDLGVQIEPETFVSTIKKSKADAIGMSALLVQTASHMLTVSEIMSKENIDIPILIGGAPINKNFAVDVAMAGKESVKEIKSNVFYCASSMDGINVLEKLNSNKKEEVLEKNKKELTEIYKKVKEKKKEILPLKKRAIKLNDKKLPDLNFKIETVKKEWNIENLNIKALHSINWKLKKILPEEEISEWIEMAKKENITNAVGKIAFFECNSDGKDLIIYKPGTNEEIEKISFKKLISKDKKEYYYISSYFLPKKKKKKDIVGFLISRAGIPNKEIKNRLDNEASFMLTGISNRIAEDMANFLHQKIAKKSLDKKLTSRYSPGYSALSIKNNKVIYKLLKANKIGIGITEAGEFLPLSTTAAIVCLRKK